MKLITNNPYRQLGLLVGSSAKQENNHKTRINQYLEAEQDLPAQYIENGFDCLGEIHRTTTAITNATANIALDADKMTAALFWFIKGNEITDEPAFDALKDNDVNTAIDIWSKLTANGVVTARNYSAYQNLSTLLLCKGYNEKTLNTEYLNQSIALKIRFLDSDYCQDFKTIATDSIFKISKKELQLLFLNSLLIEIEKTQDFGLNHLFKTVNSLDFTAKFDFLNSFALKLITGIETNIELAKSKRKQNKIDGIKVGNDLSKYTAVDLFYIRKVFGPDNLKYTTISDKVAEEILQCGIDYFKHFKNSDFDPSQEAMELLEEASEYAVGNIVMQRCEENIKQLQEWIDEKPERELQNKIGFELNQLIDIFNAYEKKNASIDNALNLIEITIPLLSNIKNKIGEKDEIYLKLSTRIAAQAQSFVIDWINKFQSYTVKELNAAKTYQETAVIKLVFKLELEKATKVFDLIENLDLEYDFRTNRYNNNKASLLGLSSQLGVSSVPKPQPTPPPPSENNGCLPVFISIGIGVLIGGIIDGFNGGGIIIFGGFVGFIVGAIIIGNRN